MSTIVRYYDEDKNPPVRVAPDGTKEYAYISGVPLRDLTEDDFNALPKHLQNSVDASPLYRKTKPPSRATERNPERSKSSPRDVTLPAHDARPAISVETKEEAADGN